MNSTTQRIVAALLLAIPLLLSAAEDDGVLRALPAPVARVISGHGLDAGQLSLYAHEVGAPLPLLAVSADAARNPASTIKLLTTFAALDQLGPAYRWETEVYLLGSLHNGRLDGDLLLRGGGDPWLVQERLWLLLRELHQRGLVEIAGGLRFDRSYFAPEVSDPNDFDGQGSRTYNVRPDALLINLTSTRFLFTPDRQARHVHIEPDPPTDNMRIDNQLRLVDRPCGGYQRGIAMHATPTESGARVRFTGEFPARCKEYSLSRSVLQDPGAYAWGVISAMWRGFGGSIAGGWRNDLAPPDEEPFYTFRSPALAEIIRSINKYSSNVMTRQLLLTMGAEHTGTPGTHANGIAAVQAWLAEEGMHFPELELDNGAGLSRTTRISARHMGELLLTAEQSPWAPEFIASLPLAGMDGTLRRRFGKNGKRGLMHVKTGRLDHVQAIAGFMRTRSGRDFVIVALHNDRNVHRGPGEEAQRAFLDWMFER